MHSGTNPRVGWRYRGKASVIYQSPLLREQRNKGSDQFHPANPLTHHSCTARSVQLQGTGLGFYGLITQSTTSFTLRAGPLIPRQPDHRGETALPKEHRAFSITPLRSEKPQHCERTKNLCLSPHLLKNNGKTPREMSLIHRCLDKEGIHQISLIAKVMRQLKKKMKPLHRINLKMRK